MGYETSAERWSPVQSVEKILLSVVSMLAGNYNHTCIIHVNSATELICFKLCLWINCFLLS